MPALLIYTLLAVAVSLASLFLGWLDAGGALAAAALGFSTLALYGYWGAAVLLSFVAIGSLGSRINNRSRDRNGRKASQVLANGLPALLGGLLLGRAFFAAALAAAAADTAASEIGSFSSWAWRPGRGMVPPGSNAAVSAVGSIALVATAAFMSLWGGPAGLRWSPLFAAAVSGAVFDTISGPLEEKLSWWNNDVNNAVASSVAGLLASFFNGLT